MRPKRLTTAAIMALLVSAPAYALENCKVRVDKKTGVITVSASGISGPALWGKKADAVTQTFFNAANCVTGASASRCELADPATLAAKTPPPGCTLYLEDDATACSAWIVGCSPGSRSIDDEGGGDAGCGNGIGEVGEACDGLDLNGKTCESEAPQTPFGTLSCNADCTAVVTTECLPRFQDNGDGTVTDRETRLMWERKDDVCPGAHCTADSFPWSTGDPWAPDGTLFTTFLATLNDSLFAGYGDWRIPSINELQSIIDWSPGLNPTIDQNAFGPTQSFGYWTSTVATYGPSYAYNVYFADGDTGVSLEIYPHYARAVRTGL